MINFALHYAMVQACFFHGLFEICIVGLLTASLKLGSSLSCQAFRLYRLLELECLSGFVCRECFRIVQLADYHHRMVKR